MKNLYYLIPGFLTYVLLRPFGLFNFYDSADRQITLLILSIANGLLTNVIINSMNIDSMTASIIVSIIVTIGYVMVFGIYRKVTPFISEKFNQPLIDNKSSLETSLYDYSVEGEVPFIICFDFQNNYIVSGYYKNVDEKSQQIELHGKSEDIYTIKDARSLYSKNQKNSLIIDGKNNIKYYLIIS